MSAAQTLAFCRVGKKVQDILPDSVPDRTYLADARHISPYFAGFIELRFNGEGIQVRWYGDERWADMLTWAELAFKAGVRNEQFRDELHFTRQDAYNDGYQAGLRAGRNGEASAA